MAASAGLKTEADLLALYPVGKREEPTVREALEGVTIHEDERQTLLRSMRRSSTYELLKSLPRIPTRRYGLRTFGPTGNRTLT